MLNLSVTQSRLWFCTAPSSPKGMVNSGPRWCRSLIERRREAFDGAHIFAAGDVFADAEGIIEQVEDTGDDVLHDGLRAEADGDADHAGTRDQRADLDAHRGQDHENRHDRQ